MSKKEKEIQLLKQKIEQLEKNVSELEDKLESVKEDKQAMSDAYLTAEKGSKKFIKYLEGVANDLLQRAQKFQEEVILPE